MVENEVYVKDNLFSRFYYFLQTHNQNFLKRLLVMLYPIYPNDPEKCQLHSVKAVIEMFCNVIMYLTHIYVCIHLISFRPFVEYFHKQQCCIPVLFHFVI